jgi:hypothetical protein
VIENKFWKTFNLTKNIFEDQVAEYLRYNGFFAINDYVMHIDNRQAQEIDFVGIRLPHSVEQTICPDGIFSTFVFKDDYEKLALNEPKITTLLVAEVTESIYDKEIKKRIEYLKDKARIAYALQRLGVMDRDDVYALMSHTIVNINGINCNLTRVLFVINDDIVDKHKEKNKDILLISRNDIFTFIKNRAKINIKRRGRILLPPWLHNEINLLLGRS